MERDDELHAYIAKTFGLHIPRKSVCPEHQAPFDFVADAYFERESDLLALGPRSGGKTLNVAVLNVLDTAFKGASVFHLAGSKLQAQRCYEYSKRFWYLDPDLEAKLEKEPLMSETRLKGGTKYEILAASERSVRAPHAPKLRLDEIEEIPDNVWDAALSIPIEQDGVASQVVKTSTRHKVRGRMQLELEAAAENEAAVYQWCIFETMAPCKGDCKKCAIAEDCEGRARNADGYLSHSEALKAYRRVSRRVWEAERLCKKPSTEKLVYSEFDRVLHNIKRESLNGIKLSGTIDWGYDNPFVFLEVAEDGADRVFITRELYEHHLTDAELARLCRRTFPNVVEVAADPSNPGGIKAFRQEGFRVKARASKVKDGLDVVRAALRPPKDENGEQPEPRLFVVAADCPNLCGEMESYELKPGTDEPKKKNDHGPDGVRYWYMNMRRRKKALAVVSGERSR
jgi:hypothetical protein